MTKEELMQPRYRCIANYPSNVFKVGDIIDSSKPETFYMTSLENYPEIFRKLEWWEERKAEDMPTYVKVDWHTAGVDGSDQYWKIKLWEIDKGHGWVDTTEHGGREGVVSFSKVVFPSTEEEYLKNKK